MILDTPALKPQEYRAFRASDTHPPRSYAWLRTRPTGKTLYRPGIDLRFLTRAGGKLLHEPTPMRFALAVTLRGPKGSGVYGRVQQYAPALTPLVATVSAAVRANIST